MTSGIWPGTMPDIATYPSPTANASVNATASASASSGTTRATDSLTRKQLAEASGRVRVLADHLHGPAPHEGRDARDPTPDWELIGASRSVGDDLADELVAHHDVALGVPHEQPRRVVRIRMVHVVDVGGAHGGADRLEQQLAVARHRIRRLAHLETSTTQHCGTHRVSPLRRDSVAPSGCRLTSSRSGSPRPIHARSPATRSTRASTRMRQYSQCSGSSHVCAMSKLTLGEIGSSATSTASPSSVAKRSRAGAMVRLASS